MTGKKLLILVVAAVLVATTTSAFSAPALGWWFGPVGTANANFFTVWALNKLVAIWLPNGTLPYAATQYTYTYVNYTTLTEVTPSFQGVLNRLLANTTGLYVYNQIKQAPYILFLQSPYAGDIGATALYFNAKSGSTSLLSYTPDMRPAAAGSYSSSSSYLTPSPSTWSFTRVGAIGTIEGYIYGYLPPVTADVIFGVNITVNVNYQTGGSGVGQGSTVAVDIDFKDSSGSIYCFRYVFSTSSGPAVSANPFTCSKLYSYTISSGVTSSNTYILLRKIADDITAQGLNPASLILYALVYHVATYQAANYGTTFYYYLYNFIVYVKAVPSTPTSTTYVTVTATPALLVDTGSPVTVNIKGVYNMSAQPSTYNKPFTLTLSSGQTYTAPRMIYVPQSLSNWLSQYTYAVANTTDFPFTNAIRLGATPSQTYVLSNVLTGYIPAGVSYQFNTPITFVAFNGSTVSSAPSSLTIYNTKFTLTPSAGRSYLGASIVVNLTGFLNWLNQFTYAVANTTNFPFPNIGLTGISKLALTVTNSQGVNTTYTFASAPSLWLNPSYPRFYLNVSQVTCVESGANKVNSTTLTLAGGCQYSFFGFAPGSYTLLCPSSTANIAFVKQDYVGTFFGLEALDPYGRIIGRVLFDSTGTAVVKLVPNGQYLIKVYSPTEQRTWGTIVVSQSTYTIYLFPLTQPQVPSQVPVFMQFFNNGTLKVIVYPASPPATLTIYKWYPNGTRKQLASYTCGASTCVYTLNLGTDPFFSAEYRDQKWRQTAFAGTSLQMFAGTATAAERNMTNVMFGWATQVGANPYLLFSVLMAIGMLILFSTVGRIGVGLAAAGATLLFFTWRFGVATDVITGVGGMLLAAGIVIAALERVKES